MISPSTMRSSTLRATALTAAFLALASGVADASTLDTALGRWKTIDEKTGEPKAVVEITQAGDSLRGRIVELLNPSRPHPVCDNCEGDRHNQPIEGMTILWGGRIDDGRWVDGKILDPETGKVYSAQAEPADDGQHLKVRGYIGLSLIGRSQEWTRAAP